MKEYIVGIVIGIALCLILYFAFDSKEEKEVVYVDDTRVCVLLDSIQKLNYNFNNEIQLLNNQLDSLENESGKVEVKYVERIKWIRETSVDSCYLYVIDKLSEEPAI